MKKSQKIALSSILFAALSSCNNRTPEWSDGKDATGHTRDTAVYHGGAYHYYRYFGGGWRPLHRNNLVDLGETIPASSAEISNPSFTPRSALGGLRGGGFGGSGEASGGE